MFGFSKYHFLCMLVVIQCLKAADKEEFHFNNTSNSSSSNHHRQSSPTPLVNATEGESNRIQNGILSVFRRMRQEFQGSIADFRTWCNRYIQSHSNESAVIRAIQATNIFPMSEFDRLMQTMKSNLDEDLILNLCFLLAHLMYVKFFCLNSYDDQWLKDKRKILYEILLYLERNKPSSRNFVARCRRILGRTIITSNGHTRTPRSVQAYQPAMNPSSLCDRIFSFRHYPTIADTLARNGFYCSGNMNSATCFRCGFQIRDIHTVNHYFHPCSNGIAEFANITSTSHKNFLQNLNVRMESERYRTFEHWPSERPTVYPADLARSGFFYLGNLDRVQCFSCGGVLRNWNYGDNVQAEHCRHFPHCKMTQGGTSRNVSLTPDERAAVSNQASSEQPDPSGNEAETLLDLFPCRQPSNPHMRNESNRFETFNQHWLETQVNATPQDIARAGFFYLGKRDRVQCWYCNGGLQNWEPQDEPWTEHAKWFPTCEFLLQRKGPDFVHRIVAQFPNLQRPVMQRQDPSPRPLIVNFAAIPNTSHQDFLRNLNLTMERERLRTFHGWERSVYPADLARSGFFYLGNLDRVQCFSCSGVLRNWDYGNNVQAEHRRYFPHCKMCQGAESRNVQLTPDERAAVPSQQTVFHEPPDPSENEARDLRNSFQCQYPVSPHMRNEDTRFESFDHRWPASQVNATPRQIARAGFFFLGERDRVKCWYCNGGLQNWDPQDEPWTEHAKWFPTCEFVLQRKGPDFVHRMVSMFPNLPRPLLRGPHDVAPPNPGRRIQYGTTSAWAPSPPPPIIDPQAEMQKIQDAMNSDIAKAALEMGFDERVIHRIVKRRIRHAAMYTTVAELVDDVTGNTSDLSDSDDEENENSMQALPSTSAKTPGTERSPSMQARDKELLSERKCKICLDNMADVVFVPCGHLCSCVRCAEALRKCPMCRKKIEKAIRTYIC